RRIPALAETGNANLIRIHVVPAADGANDVLNAQGLVVSIVVLRAESTRPVVYDQEIAVAYRLVAISFQRLGQVFVIVRQGDEQRMRAAVGVFERQLDTISDRP